MATDVSKLVRSARLVGYVVTTADTWAGQSAHDFPQFDTVAIGTGDTLTEAYEDAMAALEDQGFDTCRVPEKHLPRVVAPAPDVELDPEEFLPTLVHAVVGVRMYRALPRAWR